MITIRSSDAGSNDLTDTDDFITGMGRVGENLIIYKQDSLVIANKAGDPGDPIHELHAAEGTLTVKDLLLYSAVCGTGLDTVPLAGDVSKGQIAALLLDIAAMSLRLAKPLTARLMPIPGKQAGDKTEFDFAFFANSRVMELDAAGLGHPFAGDEVIQINPRC